MTLRLVLVALLAAGNAMADDKGPLTGLDQRINLELVGAAAADVFNSFAVILEAEPELDPGLAGEVTIQLSQVSARTTLDAVCEMLDCKWWIEDGPPRRLRVKANAGALSRAAQAAGDLDTRVSLALVDAPAEEVFKSFASIGRWKLALDRPTVSIDLVDTPIRDALDAVCAQIECVWTLDELGDEGVLRVDWVE